MCIKATDLRVGNLVTLDENQRRDLWHNQIHAMKDVFMVKTIYSDGDIALELDDEIVDINLKDVSPIPLTEEWLLKFGFSKYHSNLFVLEKSGFSIHFYMLHEYYYLSFDNRRIEIKYVHQLQNLFFVLNGGEELIIK
jgi:hypothetical protein